MNMVYSSYPYIKDWEQEDAHQKIRDQAANEAQRGSDSNHQLQV
jgi:hypothetical protein